MTSPNLRLFVAVPVPREQLEWVATATEQLRSSWPQARWVPIENQHVTLKFLGSVAAVVLEDVVVACRGVAGGVAPTSIRLASLGAFPNQRRARVLWAGLEDPGETLTRLTRGLDVALQPLGIEAEKRAFSPHLTLARFKVPQPLGGLPDLGATPDPFRLEAFCLWRSHLSPKGARYELVEAFGLRDRHEA